MSERCAWCQVIVMVTVPCAVAGDGDRLYQIYNLFWERKFQENIFCDDKTIYYISQHVCPIFVLHLMNLSCKLSPAMKNSAGSLNGPFCAYSMRQNLHKNTPEILVQ